MLKIYDVPTAQKTILKRLPPDLMAVPASVLDRIEKTFGERLTPDQAVAHILGDVRERGDAALREWSGKLDGYAPDSFRVPPEALEAALEGLPAEQRAALEESARRVEAFHRRQPLISWMTNDLGGTLGQLIRPIRRVGIYIPGGTAPLPSSLLMSAIPAKVAGVSEIALVSPPQHNLQSYPERSRRDAIRNLALSAVEGTQSIASITLAAAAIAGITEVYTLGGAQAIAALAYGTDNIPAVDKIFGPGNLFVILAKRQVYGVVGIDALPGPTETVVVADEGANPAWVAADLLAQAEHDVVASAILLTPSRSLAEAVQVEVARQMEELSRAGIIAVSLENRSGAVITRDIEQAVTLANAYAPEHLCLSVRDPWRWVEKVTGAGGVFLGEHSFEVLGDYVAGPSHIMPTGGTARFSSPLNVWDFVHIVSLVALDEGTAARIGKSASVIARAEGLDGHARAAEARM